MYVQVSSSQSYQVSSIKAQSFDKKTWKAFFRDDIFKMVKRGHFEILRKKKSSNMPHVVWAEESKIGLRFEIRPSYDGLPTRSQRPSDGQSSCIAKKKTACLSKMLDFQHVWLLSSLSCILTWSWRRHSISVSWTTSKSLQVNENERHLFVRKRARWSDWG